MSPRYTQPVIAFAAALAAVFLATAGVANASESEWMDVEGRIQYGFYTEDARALTDVIAQLSRPEAKDEPMLHYYIGLANFRLSSVLAPKDRTRAREAAARC